MKKKVFLKKTKPFNMKNVLLISALLFSVSLNAQTSHSIGKCKFSGQKPKSSNIVGRMQYYHNGKVRRTRIEGGKDVYTGDGDVWVIFKSPEVARKTIFRVTGNVQTCNDF